MERLWSPWRAEYVRAPHPHDERCIFCDKPSAGDDEGNYILARSGLAFAMLNAFPYNPGHLMVAPFRHVGELEELDDAEAEDATALVRRAVVTLKEVSGPDGFNVGMNLGRVAGAGIPGHVHWHVVPRWNGDVNFVSVIGGTRVLSELLAETYSRLRPHLAP
jgi:ATP adenylyltransferase